jgi:putative ABC transport system permease protein
MLTALTQLAARLRALFRGRELDRDFAAELDAHLALAIEDNIRRGMTAAQARRAALIRMGAPISLQEQHRRIRGVPVIEAMIQDIRFALRLIAKEPWFSAAAIAALALGIGVNAIGFTIINAAFLRGLPFDEADRLYVLSWQPRVGTRSTVSYPDLQEWRTQSRSFSGLAAYTDDPVNISDDRALPEEARGAWVTAETFTVLGQQPLLGRAFTSDDDRPGADRTVILSYRVWKSRYGGSADVLGRSLRLDGQPATIIGIMPDGMNFPSNTEIWAPFVPTEAQQRRGSRPLHVFGRLRDGAERKAAQTELHGIAARLALAYPETNKDFVGVRMETFTERHVGGPARIVFLVMMGAVSFVLLIACANVANLLLSRSSHRARELAVRIALGATRWRVVRQLLLESIVLGCIGGALGLLLAVNGIAIVDAAIQDPDKPYWIVFRMDYTVFAYVAAICVLTGVLFGLAPALHVTGPDINEVLKDGGRGASGGRRARWFSGALVVAELALTIVLLAGAGLMIRSFLNVYALDPGISTEHLMAMRMQLPASKYATPDARRVFYEQLETRLGAIPGVDSLAITTAVPPFGSGQRRMEIEGRPGHSPDQAAPYVSTVTISPSFFETVGVRVSRGRAFHERDGMPGAAAVVINERLAAQMFSGEDPVGQRIRFLPRDAVPGQPPPPWLTIVGISPTIRHGGVTRGGEPNPAAYLPHRYEPPVGASLLVRSQLPSGSVMDAVRRAVQMLDRDQPVFTVQTLDEMLRQDAWPFRLFGGLFACFAVIALVLSSVGLYAVMAYIVAQRTPEIGLRKALGADARQLSWLVLKRGLSQLAIGLALGLAGALALSQVLRSVLVQITPTDPLTYVAITLILSAVALAACLVPARRATRVDPVIALRAE